MACPASTVTYIIKIESAFFKTTSRLEMDKIENLALPFALAGKSHRLELNVLFEMRSLLDPFLVNHI